MSSKVRNGMRKARKILKGFYAENSLEVGIDEAGRGPLFGRVYVGAAILHPTDFDRSRFAGWVRVFCFKRIILWDY